jgi:citrate lyase subunit beta / citryl-CoA lyase
VTPPGVALLFCPGNRSDRFAKAVEAADLAILDLEDAVPAEEKAVARRMVCDALESGGLDPDRVMVRINPLSGPYGRDDVAALRSTALRRVMLPKAADPRDLEALAPWSVLGICETAEGVLAAPALARASTCEALTWGAEDLTVDVGGRSSRGVDKAYLAHVQYARAAVLLAAAAAGRTAVDGVFTDIGDEAGLRAEASEAVAMGYAAKLAIHPQQVAPIREAFAPSVEEVESARAVLAALDAAGVATVDGRMVDEPMLRQARAVLAAAGEVASDG